MEALARSLLTVCFLLTGPVISQKPCYYPDGTLAPDHRLCLPSQEHSACCAVGNWQGADYCLYSGLCLGHCFGFMWRNSCTDIIWRHMACPSFCADVRPDRYVGLQSCTSDDSGRWYADNHLVLHSFFSEVLAKGSKGGAAITRPGPRPILKNLAASTVPTTSTPPQE
jgi:hypothetical protein